MGPKVKLVSLKDHFCSLIKTTGTIYVISFFSLIFEHVLVDLQGMAVMVFSTDEQSKKALVCAGVPERSNQSNNLKVLEWLKEALKPLEGKGGGGKGGLAQGQVW